MAKFHIIYQSFEPNTAPTNRLLSFLHSFDDAGVVTDLVLLYPDTKLSKVTDSFKNVTIHYLWDRIGLRRKRVAQLFSGISFKSYLSHQIENGDKIFLFGCAQLVASAVEVEGVEVYHERTESPEVLSLRFKRQQTEYLKSCTKLNGMFVISTALRDYFIALGVEKHRITIVNMTVDPTRFNGLIKTKTDYPYIAYCGTASNNKDGVDDLIKSYGIVVKRHPEVKLMIIGKTPTKADAANNLELIESLNLRDKIVFSGIVPASKMPQILKNAEVLVLARPDSLQAKNGFPTKLGEYLLSENPVVVTKVGDIPLFLKDGESALLAEQRNAEEIADKICWALEYADAAAAIGKRGAEVAMRSFNSKIETQKIIDSLKLVRQ